MRLYDGTFHDPLPASNELTNEEKQNAVKEAFLFAWNGYKTYSWGFDENRPVSNSPLNSRNGWGATIVDSLDTLYIMGLMDEFKEAREFVAAIDWGSTNDHVQVFETCIRYVGGLLSAYDLSHDYMFAAKAADLVERLLPAFTESPSGIPYQYVDFKTGKAVKSKYPGGSSCLAEVGAMQLEFTRLSQITGDWKYHNIGQRVYNSLDTMKLLHPGLYPHLINPETGAPASSFVTWGGMGDSFYEYLIKQYIFSQSKDDHKKKMMTDSVDALKRYMMQSPKNHDDLLFISSLQEGIDLPVMDELACFAPSALLLSARFIDGMADIENDAKRLLNGCYTAWASTRTGIAPEVFGWVSKDGSTIGDLTRHKERLAKQFGVFQFDPGYILRPETLESIYYFHQLTQEQTYQDMSWEIFNALHTYCRANSGFSGIDSVDTFFPKWDNRQESFVFAETFKYLYLMWDEPTNSPRFPLDQWVFNTEGHPFRIVNITPPTSDDYSSSSSPLSTVAQDTTPPTQSISEDLWNWLKKNMDSLGLVTDSLF
ncbi:glycoside hydrolase [Absidia repens]|uniref:alpha-1,2-Mannosidase n=1 Tax=Absidia repens TaxID=90262 RepID=A0A1X2ISZ9_9FUNG|nr:glycoside hydrolase [Absidia repens]